ncbi:HAMP domain-containing histidine kinase, partial [Romeria aff. gracilis LEGE 07310]
GSLALGLTGLGGFWLAQRAIHPVERSYEQLKQFTADASHELRGPLTAITTSVEVMQKHPERVHDKDRKKLSAIASAATQLHTLAEDLLLLARMDAQAIAAPPQKVDLNALLHRTVEFHRPAAQAKAIALQFEEKAMLSVLGYPLPLSRLFANLIQNALHYTPQGQVIVTLSQSRRSAHVCVADTGIGIAEAEFPCLFDRFWRADKARSRRIGGSGLGLAIVKAITQQHRGKISVSSQVNVGSTFHVYLPLVSSDGSMSPG